MFLKNLLQFILAAVSVRPCVGGSGKFDSVTDYTSGKYDQQTGFAFEKQLFAEARTRTFIGGLSRAGAAGGTVDDMYAGSGASLDGSACIIRKQITEGDEIRMTMREHAKGVPSFGDKPHPSGDFLAYKNMYARVNMIKSPAIPIQGDMAQQRVRASITNIPGDVKEEVVDYMAEEMERQALEALIYSASSSVLLPTSQGGLGYSPGVNAGAGAGTPLMNRHWYTQHDGFLTYSTTPATFNSTVNSAINTISTDAAHMISVPQITLIRNYMDTNKFAKVKFNGKTYKAISLIDPELWHRLKFNLGTNYQYAMPRGADNPLFNVDYQLEYDGILFIAVQNLKTFRPAYSASLGYPTFGPTMGVEDHRDYSNTSNYAMAIFLGQGALVEGYNGSVEVREDSGRFKDGLEVAARTKLGYMRGEWYAKDGRTDANAVRNYDVLFAAFYEPGVGQSYT